MRKLLVIWILFVCFCLSCNGDKQKLIGAWAIDKINVSGKNVTSALWANLIGFEKGGYCSLPQFDRYDIRRASWNIKKQNNRVYLVIESKSNKLTGRYELSFYKDPVRKLNCMYLKSSKTEIFCSKFLSAYGEDGF